MKRGTTVRVVGREESVAIVVGPSHIPEWAEVFVVWPGPAGRLVFSWPTSQLEETVERVGVDQSATDWAAEQWDAMRDDGETFGQTLEDYLDSCHGKRIERGVELPPCTRPA
jgi:hypothetical protein